MTNNLNVETMNALVTALTARLKQIQTTVVERRGLGPAHAQAKRLTAFALTRQAAGALKQVAGSIRYFLSAPAKSELRGDRLGSLVEVGEMVETLVTKLDIHKDAIAISALETNSIMLPVIEDLLTKAIAALNEADALSADRAASER